MSEVSDSVGDRGNRVFIDGRNRCLIEVLYTHSVQQLIKQYISFVCSFVCSLIFLFVLLYNF